MLTKRPSDDERLCALLALTETVGYPLHVVAYRATLERTKAVRDRLAHGVLSLTARNETTAEPGLYPFGTTEKDNRYYRLAALRSAAGEPRWLYLTPWRIALC